MAMAMDQSSRKATWKAFGKQMLSMIVSPPVLLFYLLAFTVEFWIWPSVHFYLWTFLFAPSGWPVWLLAFLFVFAFVGGVVQFFVATARLGPLRKAAREARLAGDLETRERLAQEMRGGLTGRPFTFLWIGMSSIQLLVPICVALILWNGLQAPLHLEKEHGKLRYATPRENLIWALHLIEREKYPLG